MVLSDTTDMILCIPREGCDRVKNQLHIPTTLPLTKLMFLINTCSYKLLYFMSFLHILCHCAKSL